MNLKKTKMVRMGALVTAFTLASIGAATTANAKPSGFPVVDKQKATTLTIHKHVGDEKFGKYAGEQRIEKDPVVGVEFTVTPVLCELDLATPDAWKTISKATVESASSCVDRESKVVKTAEDGSAKIDLPQGIYKVEETKSGNNLVSTKSAPFLVTLPMPKGDNEWVYDVHAYPKNKLTEPGVPTKTASEPTKFVPGAEITWTVKASIPVLQLPYESIVITDQVPAGLTFKEVTSVKIGNETLSAGTDKADYSVANGVITLTPAGLEKVNSAMAKASESMPVEVNLVTTVGMDISTTGATTNKVTLTLNGKESKPGEGTTVWGNLIVNKVNEKKELLDDAVFSIYAGKCEAVTSRSTPVVENLTTKGGVIAQKLYVGKNESDSKDYCLKETAAPAGYVLDPVGRTVTVKAGKDATELIEFENVKVEGPDLPLTGAQGAAIMVAAGLLLLAAGAGTVYVARRRNA
ncbi:SpaH/EbpB family LPXTG-anchored major pilin [Trueperella pyogenes]